jgi:hypothetical protein
MVWICLKETPNHQQKAEYKQRDPYDCPDDRDGEDSADDHQNYTDDDSDQTASHPDDACN